MEKVVKFLPHYFVSVFGAISIGMCLAWTSTTEEEILYGNAYDFILTQEKYSWVASIFTLGAACICIPMEILINAKGRKYPMLLCVLPFTIGWALLIWAQNAAMMYIARFILGIAAGGYFVVVPVYLYEITIAKYRDTAVLLYRWNITCGILLVFIFGWVFKTFITSLIGAAIPILLSLILSFMPESPTYLVRKGKIEEAKKSIKFFRSKQHDCTEELKNIQTDSDEYATKKLSFSDTFWKSTGALFVIFGLMCFQQWSGFYPIIFYTDRILKYTTTPESKFSSQFAVGLFGIILFLAGGLALLIVNRFGRRILLVVSGIIMAICTALLGYYFHILFNGESVISLEHLPLISICIFVTAFSFGYAAIPRILINEIFPTEARGVANALAGTIHWLCAFIVTRIFGDFSSKSYYSFWIFCAASIISCIFVVIFLPETKGKSLAEIQKLLSAKSVKSKSLSKIQINKK